MKLTYSPEAQEAVEAMRRDVERIIGDFKKHPLSARVVEHDGHAELVLSEPDGDSASLFTANVRAARRLARIVDDMRVLIVTAPAIELSVKRDEGFFANFPKMVANAKRDELVRKFGAEEENRRRYGAPKRVVKRMKEAGYEVSVTTVATILKKK